MSNWFDKIGLAVCFFLAGLLFIPFKAAECIPVQAITCNIDFGIEIFLYLLLFGGACFVIGVYKGRRYEREDQKLGVEEK